MTAEKVNFDNYADNYDEELKKSMGFFGEENAYFAEYKIRIVKDNIGCKPLSILEYGCGTGRHMKFLSSYFPEAKVSGCDISRKSIEVAEKENPKSDFFLIDSENIISRKNDYDLIFISCVFHHIEPPLRKEAIQNVYELMKEGGELFLFEHNVYNPLTLKIVRECAFDKDAVLLPPAETIRLVKGSGLNLIAKKYSLFFPAALKFLRPVEKYLSAIPLGGQYYVHAKK